MEERAQAAVGRTHPLASLQRSVGNAAVAAQVQRKGAKKGPDVFKSSLTKNGGYTWTVTTEKTRLLTYNVPANGNNPEHHKQIVFVFTQGPNGEKNKVVFDYYGGGDGGHEWTMGDGDKVWGLPLADSTLAAVESLLLPDGSLSDGPLRTALVANMEDDAHELAKFQAAHAKK